MSLRNPRFRVILLLLALAACGVLWNDLDRRLKKEQRVGKRPQPFAGTRVSLPRSERLGRFLDQGPVDNFDASFHTDGDGIPREDYRNIGKGLRYNPATVAGGAYTSYAGVVETGSPQDRDRLLRCADWLTDHLVARGNFGVWTYDLDIKTYDLKAPWISGFAQGLGVAALLRAYEVTRLPRYRDAAIRAFGAFMVDIEDGGVRCRDDRGNLWLEEYPASPPPHVLNGFIASVVAISEYCLVVEDPRARALLGECLSSVRRVLPRYDTGDWVLYDMTADNRPMPGNYMQTEQYKLQYLYQLTRDPYYLRTRRRWENYLCPP